MPMTVKMFIVFVSVSLKLSNPRRRADGDSLSVRLLRHHEDGATRTLLAAPALVSCRARVSGVSLRAGRTGWTGTSAQCERGNKNEC